MICRRFYFFPVAAYFFQVETVVLLVEWQLCVSYWLLPKSKTSRVSKTFLFDNKYVSHKSLFTILFCVFQNKI